MGKTFTVDPISKRRLSNFGEEDKYYIKDNHEPIISKEDFEKAQEIRLRRAGNKKTAANVNGKRERYSKMYAFSSMLECGFVVQYYLEEVGTAVQIIARLCGTVLHR